MSAVSGCRPQAAGGAPLPSGESLRAAGSFGYPKEDIRKHGPSGSFGDPKQKRPRTPPPPVGDNFLDNCEVVHVDIYPMPTGLYTVEIGQFAPFGTSNDLVDDTGAPAPQDVSIVITNVSPLNLPFRITSFVQTDSDEFALEFYSAVGGLYQIERSTDLETWTPEAGEILASAIVTSVPITATSGPTAEFFPRHRGQTPRSSIFLAALTVVWIKLR